MRQPCLRLIELAMAALVVAIGKKEAEGRAEKKKAGEPTSSPSNILARHGAVALGLEALHLRRNRSDGWSSHECVGDERTDLAAHERKFESGGRVIPLGRACVLSNVCLLPATGRWLYHTPSESAENGEQQLPDGRAFVATSSAGAMASDALAFRLVHWPLPVEPLSASGGVTMIRGLTAAMGERFPANVSQQLASNPQDCQPMPPF